MRKIPCLLLCFLLLLSGCGLSAERLKEPVSFYYLRTNYQYGSENGVIVSEEREAAGHRTNLSYLLALYRMGPASEGLCLPFPSGTSILLLKQDAQQIRLRLGTEADKLTDAEFTLACACLTLTCLNLTGVEFVTVTNSDRELTMTQADLTLYDSSIAVISEEIS